MIDRIVDASIRHKSFVFVATALLIAWGVWSIRHVPLDAIPDLSDTQVIVYSRWERSPDIVDDQVTYPIVSAMLGAPGVRDVRGISDYGYSFVYVLFEDGTDLYWARSRVQEYLGPVLADLPEGVRTELGPDASGLGWIFQYALVDDTGRMDLAELRSLQDYWLRYHLRSVPGVAEVAAVGGFRRQYQIELDPNRLRAREVPIERVVAAVREANVETGGGLIEVGAIEQMIRGRGYVGSIDDLERVVVGMSDSGMPIRVRDLGRVSFGPEERRGLADLDGRGEVVSGIVIARDGQNALSVIDAVRAKLEEVRPGLPEGVRVVTAYDRSDLVRRAIATLRGAILEIILTTSIVIFLFLRHGPSALIPILTLPIAVVLAFIPFRAAGLTANVMSLGGIAIAIGALADAAIVVVEQAHKRLEEWERDGRRGPSATVVREAILEVAGPSFFSLLVIAVAFLPVLTLEAEEGRLFKPLAYTKSLVMGVAALLVVTLDPALRMALSRRERFNFRPAWLSTGANAVLVGQIRPEGGRSLGRFLTRLYAPVVRWSLQHKRAVLVGTLVAMVVTIPVYLNLGNEFMPPFDEGALLYMPSTLPGISTTEAGRLLRETDRILAGFPEVERVLGKAGRAETSIDPAPLSMFETVVLLRPLGDWRRVETWYSSWSPEWLRLMLRRITPDHISREQLVDEMNDALRIPGLANAWTMPIKARIDMQATGIRTPVGLKISGGDLREIERLGAEVEEQLRGVPGTRGVFAERVAGGYFVDVRWRRDELARQGLTVAEAQEAVAIAIGGETVTETIEGRERYPVRVRYLADFRSDLQAIERVLVAVDEGRRQVPLGELARIERAEGPSMIRNENGLLTGYVWVDLADRDPASYVAEAGPLLSSSIQVPPGYSILWSGQYEAMHRVRERLFVVVPLTLGLILLLLWLNTRSWVKTAIVLLAAPFSAIGAIWLVWALGYDLSVGVWVGLIALLGVDAETGIFMLLYLDLSWERARRDGKLRDLADLRAAIQEGASGRLRPKLMTVTTTFVGLLPILWSIGTGADTMKRIAAPMVGGIVTSFLLELLVYPVLYELWRRRELPAGRALPQTASPPC